MSQFTKQMLAAKLKEMLQFKQLDKITVTELAESCKIKRQTFYYHFQDIYQLLGWIYKTEALEAIEHNRSYETWQQGLLLVFQYVEENKKLCINTYRSLARDHLERFLNEVMDRLLGDVVDELADHGTLSKESRDFIIRFYGYAFNGILLDWIKTGMKTPSQAVSAQITRLMEGNFLLAVERFRGI